MILEVGHLYMIGQTQFPESSQYNYRGGAHELVLFFNHPSQEEVNAVATGEATFAITFERGILFFCFQFGRVIDWSDAPYTWHMVPSDQQVPPPELGDLERSLLTIVLVDSTTGIIKALRVVTLSHQMSAKLFEDINAQRRLSFDQAQYDATLAALTSRYTSFAIRRRAHAACHAPGASN